MFLRINKALNDRRAGIKREEGFTLIELLVVVIIIGILAAIAIPVFLGVQSQAKDSAVKADLTNLKTAVVAYSTQNEGNLPLTVAALNTVVTIDAANYSTTATVKTPAFATGHTAAATSFCIEATGSNGNPFHVTDTAAPDDGLCPVVTP